MHVCSAVKLSARICTKLTTHFCLCCAAEADMNEERRTSTDDTDPDSRRTSTESLRAKRTNAWQDTFSPQMNSNMKHPGGSFYDKPSKDTAGKTVWEHILKADTVKSAAFHVFDVNSALRCVRVLRVEVYLCALQPQVEWLRYLDVFSGNALRLVCSACCFLLVRGCPGASCALCMALHVCSDLQGRCCCLAGHAATHQGCLRISLHCIACR